jgi:hypothetical protein
MADYTRDAPKELTLPPRLPLVGVPNQRQTSVETDSRLINGYVEMGEDGVLRVVKRPGLTELYTLSGLGAGMFENYSIFYTVSGGTATAKIHYDGAAGTTIESYPSSEPLTRFFHFATAPTSNDPTDDVLVYQNGFNWFISTTLQPKSLDASSITASITLGSPTATVASTTGLTEYTAITHASIPANTLIQSIDSATQFTMTANATATNAAAALTLAVGGPAIREGFSSASSIRHWVHGITVLNNSVYFFTVQRKLIGADFNEPTSWNPLNFLYVYVEQDSAISLERQLTYIVAFKSTTTEFFRDAGNTPGSPLERVEGLQLNVGCLDGRTVQSIDGSVLWVSVTESGLRSVYLMEKMKAVEIATPAVRRVLSAVTPTHGISFSVAGHSFYCITDFVAGVSLVYDITSKFWSYWQALGTTYFPFVAATVVNGVTRLQHATNGKIYVLDQTVYLDVSTPITMDIYCPQFDGNIRVAKHLARMHVVADQQPGGVLQVRNNDYDQTASRWTNWREFDLSQARPTITNCGSFTKRFYHFRHASPTPCRLTAVELELQPGVL